MCVCVSNQKRNSSTTTTHTHVERIAIEVRVQKRGNNGVKLLLFSKKNEKHYDLGCSVLNLIRLVEC